MALAAQSPVQGGDDMNKRMKDVVIVKPILYGNVAKYFGKKRESDGHTHEWKVYIKPYYKEDISKYIKKVSFKLHESYPVNVRLLTKPPFEISETGWGEFELVIKIYFYDPNERPVTLYHMLKLFKTKDAATDATNSLLYNEYYEELIFSEPTRAMYNTLLTPGPQITPVGPQAAQWDATQQSTLAAIHNAHSALRAEIEENKKRIQQARDLVVRLSTKCSKIPT